MIHKTGHSRAMKLCGTAVILTLCLCPLDLRTHGAMAAIWKMCGREVTVRGSAV